jgi:hypothetical protein
MTMCSFVVVAQRRLDVIENLSKSHQTAAACMRLDDARALPLSDWRRCEGAGSGPKRVASRPCIACMGIYCGQLVASLEEVQGVSNLNFKAAHRRSKEVKDGKLL